MGRRPGSTAQLETGAALEPGRECSLCARLVEFRRSNRTAEPAWFNAPVPTFRPSGSGSAAAFAIVGLAPGRGGANRTGRPFTGDYAGELLYETLIDFGFAAGAYAACPDDGLRLQGCLITNAVRCVPPENKPTPAEITTCRQFLKATLTSLPGLKAVLALGRIAHESTLHALGARRSAHPFAHGARHPLSGNLVLFDSYHCSRYNTNTGRLTRDMFREVFAAIRAELSGP